MAQPTNTGENNMTTYTAYFRTDSETATRTVEADSPEQALSNALELYTNDPSGLWFEPTKPNKREGSLRSFINPKSRTIMKSRVKLAICFLTKD
jgi:hypothetical protein